MRRKPENPLGIQTPQLDAIRPEVADFFLSKIVSMDDLNDGRGTPV
jgi:hypothetical protein